MGYAIEHRHVLVLMADIVFAREPNALGYVGPMYFNYFEPDGHALYFVAGIGAQVGAWSQGGGSFSIRLPDFGFGPCVRAGLGYEVAHHIQCDLMAGVGKTSRHGTDHRHFQISFNLRFHTY
jgi:hypothetical protein